MATQHDDNEALPQVALVLTSNLFFIPRIESAAIRSGMEAIYGNSAVGLLKSTAGRDVALALIDLETEDAVWEEGLSVLSTALKSKPGAGIDDHSVPSPIIAYGPHGDAETLRKAPRLGCDAVLTKRDFSSRLLELMGTRGQAVISS